MRGDWHRLPQSVQSEANAQSACSEPIPPSSHTPSDGYPQLSVQQTVGAQRYPQSEQSVPCEQSEYSEPSPPSSQTPSEKYWHASWQQVGGGRGDGGGGGVRGDWHRLPQSVQSEANAQSAYCEPIPPSSHTPSDGCPQLSVQQTVGAQRYPQSEQSVPSEQSEYSESSPPSSQTPSEKYWHVSWQQVPLWS